MDQTNRIRSSHVGVYRCLRLIRYSFEKCQVHSNNFIDDTIQPRASLCVQILHTNQDVNVCDISLVVLNYQLCVQVYSKQPICHCGIITGVVEIVVILQARMWSPRQVTYLQCRLVGYLTSPCIDTTQKGPTAFNVSSERHRDTQSAMQRARFLHIDPLITRPVRGTNPDRPRDKQNTVWGVHWYN